MKNLFIITVLSLLTLTACARQAGPAERFGERTDEIIDNVREGEPVLKKKGTLEKTGEAIDEAINGE